MARYVALLLLALGICACRAFAQVAPDTAESALQLGEKYFRGGDYAKAHEQFMKALEEDPSNVETNFWLGRAAFEMEDYDAAVAAFERVLALRPGLPRVQLELARSYFQLRAYEVTVRRLREILDTNPPENVRRNIEDMLARIETSRQPSILTVFSSLMFNRDTNARLGTDQSVVNTPKGPMTVAPEDRKVEDDFISSTTIFDHKLLLSEASNLWWSTTGILYSSFYTSEHDLNTNSFLLLSGPAMRTDQYSVELRGLLAYQTRKYSGDLRSGGAMLSAITAVSDQIFLNAVLKIEDRRFLNDSDKDAINYTGDFGPIFVWGNNRLLSKIGYEGNDAAAGSESYGAWNFLTRYERQWTPDFVTYLSYGHSNAPYRGIDNRFGFTRHDRIQEFAVGASRRIWRNLAIEASYAHTISDSNIPLHDFGRDLYSLGLSVKF